MTDAQETFRVRIPAAQKPLSLPFLFLFIFLAGFFLPMFAVLVLVPMLDVRPSLDWLVPAACAFAFFSVFLFWRTMRLRRIADALLEQSRGAEVIITPDELKLSVFLFTGRGGLFRFWQKSALIGRGDPYISIRWDRITGFHPLRIPSTEGPDALIYRIELASNGPVFIDRNAFMAWESEFLGKVAQRIPVPIAEEQRTHLVF